MKGGIKLDLISVIIPVYNVEKYLKQCIYSIINQTYSNLEIILVDDGSPDNCGVICDEFALKDKRIKVIHQENRGLSGARNSGIDAAKGEYICFVDSDDFVGQDYCKILYELLKDTNYDFSVCGVCRFNDGEDPIITVKNRESTVWENKQFLRQQLDKKSEFGIWNKLYRRNLFNKIRFANGRLNEDVIWSGDLAINTKNCIETKAQQYFYRQRKDGIVGKQSERCSLDFLYAGNYLIEIADKLYPELIEKCLYYTISYAWLFVDRIYVNTTFKQDYLFLKTLQKILKKYEKENKKIQLFEGIQEYRMKIFSHSVLLYGLNAYLRLLRVYCYRIVSQDPYKSGHGI